MASVETLVGGGRGEVRIVGIFIICHLDAYFMLTCYAYNPDKISFFEFQLKKLTVLLVLLCMTKIVQVYCWPEIGVQP